MGPNGHISRGVEPFGIVETDWYLNLNPTGAIPTIEDNDQIIWDSGAILVHFAIQHSPDKLIAGRIQDIPKAISWINWTNEVLEPQLHHLVMHLVRLPPGERDPAIVEEALLGHEAVAFAGAIGQPDQRAGELPCVYVELVDGANVTPEELDKFCSETVKEKAALPKHVEILTELPKTAVGKVFKPDLRKRAITRVFTETLSSANVNATITSVEDDKKLGLVANISSNEEDSIINEVLGEFTIPWQRVSK